jgi:hypothetical protein
MSEILFPLNFFAPFGVFSGQNVFRLSILRWMLVFRIAHETHELTQKEEADLIYTGILIQD